jgi:2-polyprenyl-3-methyl-5-hydroxy-6-metoxy-1,4-benzoquinol methylase
MSHPHDSLYDRNDYYLDNARASRLSPILDGILYLLEWERIVAAKRHLRGRVGAILDVGAGDGKFLRFMQRLGFSSVGTTASQRSAQRAAAGGVRMYLTETLDGPREHAPYTLITYWHVFEHLSDPAAHVSQWRDLLDSEGLLLIEVPNIESIGAKLCYDAWLGSDPVHHINHQPLAKIVAQIEAAGLKVRGVDHFSLKFTYVFLWSALLGRLFPRRYDFDSIMHLLKSPLARLRAAPLSSLNAMASVVYLAPIILGLSAVGVLTRRGEAIRVYAHK